MEIGFLIWEIIMIISIIGATIWEIKTKLHTPEVQEQKGETMKQRRKIEPYERRLYSYNQEKQLLLQKNPMASPSELQEAIKKLAHKYKI